MAIRLWLMLVVMVVAVAALLPGSVFAQDEEPYSGGTVPATTLVTTTTQATSTTPPTTDPGDNQATTVDPSATVLGNTLGRGGEQLPNTGGFQSGWLAAGGLMLLAIGVSLVWIVRSRSDA